MNRFYFFKTRVFKKDLVIQERVPKEVNLPGLTRIVVLLSFKDIFFKVDSFLTFFIFAFEFLTLQKPTISFSRKDVSFWRLRKKEAVGLLVTFNVKKPFSFLFLERIFSFSFPKAKPFVKLTSQFGQPEVSIYHIPSFFTIADFGKEIFRHHGEKSRQFKLTVLFFTKPGSKNFFQAFQIPFSKKNA